MHIARFDISRRVGTGALVLACALALTVNPAAAQPSMHSGMGAGGRPATGQATQPAKDSFRDRVPVYSPGDQPPVLDVQIRGHDAIAESKIRSYLKTRKDRPFDPELVQADVRALMATGLFSDVRTYQARLDAGVSVTFEVLERATIRYVKFRGNESIREKHLRRESGLEVGEAMNVYSVEDARRKLEDFYRSKGFAKAQISIWEGDQPDDRGVIFTINEGKLQRVLWTRFVGNKVATDARLKTQIQSKPGILWMFRGRVDRQKIDEDVERLTAYYRSLGYFRARISRELDFTSSGKWLTLSFIIDEGPRYIVRNVAFVGNNKYESEHLAEQVALKSGEPFDLKKLNKDVRTLSDLYGTEGHIFADIQADPRFLEDPGELDVVYDISEGAQYYVGRINVTINGENPHTRRSVVMPRIGFQPGDLVNTRKIRDAERRLKSSQLFLNDPTRGVQPRVVVRPPELSDRETAISNRPADRDPNPRVRGQSPDAPAWTTWGRPSTAPSVSRP